MSRDALLSQPVSARRNLHASTPTDSLALKLVCDLSGNHQLIRRFRDAVDPRGLNLNVVKRRPWWLTESVIDDAIWESDRALSWLADGEACTALRQLDLGKAGATGPWPDFVFVGKKVRIVELEKDGNNKASQQLADQWNALRNNGQLDPAEEVDVVALDAAMTRPPPGVPNFSSRCWHLAEDPDAPMVRWIVLSREPHSTGITSSARGRRHGLKHRSLELPESPFTTYITEGEVLTRECVQTAVTLHVGFHSQKGAAARKASGQPAFIRPGTMMKHGPRWLKDIGHHLWERETLRERGALGWEVWHAKGRGGVGDSGELLIHFEVKDGAPTLDQVADLATRFTWPDPKSW